MTLAATTPRPPGVTGRQRHHHHQGVRRHADADTCCVAARDKDRVIGLLADQQRLLASTDSAVLGMAEPERVAAQLASQRRFAAALADACRAGSRGDGPPRERLAVRGCRGDRRTGGDDQALRAARPTRRPSTTWPIWTDSSVPFARVSSPADTRHWRA